MQDNKKEYNEDFFAKYDKAEEDFFDSYSKKNKNKNPKTDSIALSEDSTTPVPSNGINKEKSAAKKVLGIIVRIVFVFLTFAFTIVSLNTTNEYTSLSKIGERVDVVILNDGTKLEDGDFLYEVSVGESKEKLNLKADIKYKKSSRVVAFLINQNGDKVLKPCDNADMTAYLAMLLCIITSFLFFKSIVIRLLSSLVFGAYALFVGIYAAQNSTVSLTLTTIAFVIVLALYKEKKRKLN